MITYLGAQRLSNPLGDPNQQTSLGATRSFLVFVPRIEIETGEESLLRLEAILSRDRYGMAELSEEELSFSQFTGRYEQLLADGDNWSLGLGLNRSYLGYGDVLQGQRQSEEDQFIFATYRLGLGGEDWMDFSYEWREQDLTDAAADRNFEEDATVRTLDLHYQGIWGAGRANFRVNAAEHDAEGLLVRKRALFTSANYARYLGPLIGGVGLAATVDHFTGPRPGFNNVEPHQVLRTLTFDLTWPLSTSVFLSAQGKTEELASNFSVSEYENEAFSFTVIHVY